VVCAKKLVRHFKTGFYFGSYRDTTIKRRITRRVLLRGGSSDRAELEPLYQDILNQCDEVFPGAGAVRVNCLASLAIARKIADRALQVGIAPDRPFAPLGR
jgi:hypothetical protein